MSSVKTEIIKVDPTADGTDAARRAADVLARGGLVVFPTETVYGVAARVDRADAMIRLRRVKSRKAEQAFTVHLGSGDDASRYVPRLTGLAARFIRKGWPGPLTLILDVDEPETTAVHQELGAEAAAALFHRKTIGLRCPDDPIAGAILRGMDSPVVAASANPTGQPAPMTAGDVLRTLDGRIDLLIDAGRTRYGKPSTIVRVTGSSYTLVREGVYDAGIIDRLAVLRLLFVCTGNTCRTPMAAALARHMIAQRLGCRGEDLSAHRVEVWSAGTAGGFGGASAHAVTVMARRGVDLSDHTSSALTPEMVQQADYVFAMTQSHRRTIMDLVPSAGDHVRLLLDGEDVSDPIGGTEEDYERCARTVEEGLRARLEEINL